MSGIIGKAMAGLGQGMAQVGLIELQNQAALRREKKLEELRAASQKQLSEQGHGHRKEEIELQGRVNRKLAELQNTLNREADMYGEPREIPGLPGVYGQRKENGKWEIWAPDKSGDSPGRVMAEIARKVMRGQEITQRDADAFDALSAGAVDPITRITSASTGHPMRSGSETIQKYVPPAQTAPQQPAAGAFAPITPGAAKEGDTVFDAQGREYIVKNGVPVLKAR